MGKKSLTLRMAIKLLTFQLKFVEIAYLMDLVLLVTLKKIYIEICLIFSVDKNSDDKYDV